MPYSSEVTSPGFVIDLNSNSTPQEAEFNAAFPAGSVIPVSILNNSYTVYCRSGSSDIRSLVDTFSGQYHIPERPLPNAPIILDLGSNIGTTLMHYGAIYPRSRLFGVEMDAENVEMARKNTEFLGGRCTVLHAAVAAVDGEVRYQGNAEFAYNISPSGAKCSPGLSMRSVLSAFGLHAVDFLKIDIEGAELEVFSGDLGWLESIFAIYLEVHASAQHLEGILKLLNSQGFAAWKTTHHWSGIYAVRQ